LRDRQTPGDWNVQWTDDDGGFEMAIFSGPRAHERSSSRSGATVGTKKSALTKVRGRDMAARGLYKETDGSWRQVDGDKGAGLLYRLKKRERWTLL
jgi:hypothetical protein